jgi:TRAP-type mannitol/chloroaromatic compound transport system permease small subunit
LGGAYSLQMDSHVRMDLLYGSWSPRTQIIWDAFTILFMIFYLALLLYGAVSSTIYAVEFQERSFSIWQPYMWPIKSIMTFGIIMMLLQAFSQLFKDIAAARGHPLT